MVVVVAGEDGVGGRICSYENELLGFVLSINMFGQNKSSDIRHDTSNASCKSISRFL